MREVRYMLDEVDQKIIEILKKNARNSFAKIAEEINLSETDVRNRIKKLLDNEVIKRFTIEVDEELQIKAIILISATPSRDTPDISQEIIKLDGVSYLYELTGEYDIIAILSTTTLEKLNKCIEKIRVIDGILSTNTSLILRSWF